MKAPFHVLGQFGSGDGALAAVRDLGAHGHRRLDAYTPYPVEGMAEALRLPRSWVRWAALAGGILGGGAGYLVQWFTNAWNWPLDVGDRPPHAWPAFILLTYEGIILVAAFAIVGALLVAWRLPNLHHPALGAEGFESATGDGFWVAVEAPTEEERDAALARLRALGATLVQTVAEEEE